MPKALVEYKKKIIAYAIQVAQKEGLNTYYGHDKLADKIKTKIEFTGNLDTDLANILATIKGMTSNFDGGL